MKKAWIEDNRVRDIAPGNPADLYHPDIAQLYDTDVPDDTQNGAELVGGVWVNPLPPVPQEASPPPPQVRQITGLAFFDRFTDAEAVAIDLASIGATAQAAGMRRYMSKVNAATYIDLERADTRAGVLALEAGGLLAEGRALEILDAPVLEHERWRAGV